MASVTILHAPTPLGLKPPSAGSVPGTRKMPKALRAAGLHDALEADYAGTLRTPRYKPDRDPDLGVLNPHGIREYSVRLADEVGRLLSVGRFPLVLGGDCSVLIGCSIALRRRGVYGLVFLDGHTDLLTPGTSKTGGVAGMDLAIVTGRAVQILADVEGLKPYLPERHVAQMGCRDQEQMGPGDPPVIPGSDIRLFSLTTIRELGPSAAAEGALEHLAHLPDGIWVHLDADVLDDDVMPAVDSRQPDGLSLDELTEILQTLVASGRVRGMNIGIYDPELDSSGEIGRAFAGAITAGLRDL